MPSIELRAGRSRFSRGVTTALVLYLSFQASVKSHSQQTSLPAPPAQTPFAAPGKPVLPPLPAPPTNHLSVQPAFSVVIDAAHGGANTGARIASNIVEKDTTLALSGRLRTALATQGVAVVMTRESDTDAPANQRAGIANHALASACLIIHATATGAGVHLFTSSLPPAVGNPSASATPAASALIPWQTAQAAWVTHSLRLTSEINSALGHAAIPTTLGIASVAPLDNLTCPAVAVEVAPLTNSATNPASSISDSKYQQRIIDALVSAILEWRTDWKQQP
jgi:N-acetylmuramoyl-L-alanine amidase